MATIVNNPAPSGSDGGMNAVLTAILLIALILVLAYFFVPALRQLARPSSPQINVPDKVDINVNQQQPQGQQPAQ